MHTLNPFEICETACQVILPPDESIAARISCYNSPIPNTASADINGGER